MLWDTNREREINLGRAYNFEALGYGECNINEKLETILGVKEGDIVYFTISLFNLFSNIATKYNAYAAANNK
jgi:hypothetical protein